ncbi:hypothetical protein UAJ10_18260 [Nitrospirillum sp. BR 11164]|uniref:hypothetical protein n=1 Tax=Nitrospirillum sp. BR 11164 TaxID=3104324 RepID=UPI002AFE98B1|nr:hypothetical protein [Nitrospirillum sp. BR 11164]MEA1650953.1 hypothetical protein [Nitrospirillum sp. BR 11164]
MILPALLDKIRANLARWEGEILWMYLDTEGLVTVGCGTMLPTAESAAALPFYNKNTFQAVSKSDIESAWKALAAGKDEQKKASHKHAAAYYRDKTDLLIQQQTADDLLDVHINADHLHLKLIYSNFDNFPDDAKIALFDMIYNLGAGHGKTRHHRATGLMAYSNMNHAVNSGNWAEAAKCCFRHGISAERNRQTAALFQNCAATQNGRSS